MLINYKKYLKNLLLDIEKEKEFGGELYVVEDRFKYFYLGWLSLLRYGILNEMDLRKEINAVFKSVLGMTLDEKQDIGQRMANDFSKSKHLSHEQYKDFIPTTTKEEIEKYLNFNRIIGY